MLSYGKYPNSRCTSKNIVMPCITPLLNCKSQKRLNKLSFVSVQVHSTATSSTTVVESCAGMGKMGLCAVQQQPIHRK